VVSGQAVVRIMLGGRSVAEDLPPSMLHLIL
jgi:hypothetical protein